MGKPVVRQRTVRVPNEDLNLIGEGRKREFRTTQMTAHFASLPEPCVIFSQRRGLDAGKLVVVTASWRERLGEVSEESAQAEGFENRREFKRYWRRSRGKEFEPLLNVVVIRCRPFEEKDRAHLAEIMFDSLYGYWS